MHKQLQHIKENATVTT